MKPSPPVGLCIVLASACCAILVAAISAQSPPTQSQPQRPSATGPAGLGQPVRVGRLQHPGIRESSGIAASCKRQGAYWTMNDSGNPTRLYAFDQTGRNMREVTVEGAGNEDWEDIAIDPQTAMLYIADVGDNEQDRDALTLYGLPEPDPQGQGPVKVTLKRTFRYPKGHGSFDCESLFVRSGWAYLLTKELLFVRMYRVNLAAEGKDPVTAEYLGALPGAVLATGADISPDGRRLAVLSYAAIFVYDLPKPVEELVKPMDAPVASPFDLASALAVRPQTLHVRLGQCEAICWKAGETATELMVTNEGREIYRIAPAGTTSRPAGIP